MQVAKRNEKHGARYSPTNQLSAISSLIISVKRI
jgi:hypothetical protein